MSVASNGGYRVGERVAVRYLVQDPATAEIDTPGRLWMDVIATATIAALCALAVITFLVLGSLEILYAPHRRSTM